METRFSNVAMYDKYIHDNRLHVITRSFELREIKVIIVE